MNTQPVRLDDFGDVLTLADIAALLRRKPRGMERFVTMQRRSGVQVLPQEIPGFRHRYRKDDVARWLKTGIPGRIARSRA